MRLALIHLSHRPLANCLVPRCECMNECSDNYVCTEDPQRDTTKQH